MSLIRSDAILTGIAFGGVATAQILDMTVVRIGNLSFVYAVTNDPLAGILQLQMTATGDLTYVANLLESGERTDGNYIIPANTGLGTVLRDGVVTLVTAGQLDQAGFPYAFGLHFMPADAGGTLTWDEYYSRQTTSQSWINTLQMPGDDFIFEVRNGSGSANDTLLVSQVNNTNLLTNTYTIASSVADQTHQAALVDGDMMFFFVTNQNAIGWTSFTSTGLGQFQGTISGSQGFGSAQRPTDLEVVKAGSNTFLVSANPVAGLVSYEINSGLMVNTPIADRQAEGAAEIVTFSMGGRGFVATADDRLTVYEIGEDGAFFAMNAQALTAGTVNDIDVVMRGSAAYIVVAASDGAHSFAFVPGQAQNVTGTNAANTIRGDTRDNQFDGRGGNDRLYGVDGEDFLIGGQGADIIDGGRHDDAIYGGTENDRLYGGDQNDRVYGGDGNDRTYGGTGHDQVYGGNGGDWLSDGAGADRLYGGANADRFILTKDTNTDTIMDWSGSDLIDLRSYGTDLDFADLRISARSNGTLVVVAEGDTLVIDSAVFLRLSHIDASDFVFA